MASSYSSSLFLELMETGANASTWGTNTNENLKVIDSYLSGVATIGVSGGTVNVASANADPTSDAANKILEFTGTLTSNATVTLPNVEGNYLISTLNMTFDGFTVDVAPFGNTGASVSLNEDAYHWVYISGGVAKNGLSNLSSVTINGDLSNVTGNATITGNTSITGNISVSGNVIANLDFSDNVAARFGDSQDLQIYHDGSNSYIQDGGAGDLLIQGSSIVRIRTAGGAEEMASFTANGASVLYHDNTSRISTTSSGASITGDLTTTNDITVTGGEISTNGNIESGRGSGGVALTINDGHGNANVTFNHKAGNPEQDGNSARIVVNTDSTSDAKLEIELASDVTEGVSPSMVTGATFSDTDQELYYSGSKKLNTTSSGIHVVGDVETDDGTIGNIAVRNLFTTTSTSTPNNSTGDNGDFYLIHES